MQAAAATLRESNSCSRRHDTKMTLEEEKKKKKWIVLQNLGGLGRVHHYRALVNTGIQYAGSCGSHALRTMTVSWVY